MKKRTEGEQGRTTISQFITKAGEIIQSEGLKERQFEVVGDSYTCGYGAEKSVKTDKFTPETENSNLTYAAIIARYFNADYYSISHSGMGIARNYSDKFIDVHMPDRYNRTFDEDDKVKWCAADDAFRRHWKISGSIIISFSVKSRQITERTTLSSASRANAMTLRPTT